MPLERHAEWKPRKKRADPIAVLERQSTSRMPDLVPLRYGRMAAYLGATHGFESAIGEFAIRYADMSEADHERLIETIALGQTVAEPDV